LRQFESAIPETLCRIVRRATEKEPSIRYSSAAEFARAISDFLDGPAGSARPGSAWGFAPAETADRPSPRATSPLGSGTFPRCAVCTETIVSKLSVAGVCPECQAPICAKCFKVRGIRHCPQHQPKKPEELSPSSVGAVTPPLTRPPITRESGPAASHEIAPTVVLAPQAAPSPLGSGAAEPAPASASPDGEQPPPAQRAERSQAEGSKVSARQAALAEQTFLRIVEDALHGVSQIRDPLRDFDLPVGDWRKIREQTDRLSQLRPAWGGRLPPDTSQGAFPRGVTLRHEVRQRNLTGSVRGHVLVEACNLARIERFAGDGADAEPLTQMELEGLLNTAARRAADAGAWHVLILASPTGWSPEARDFATGQGPRAFRDRCVSVVLYDAAEGRFLINSLDEKLRGLQDAFSSDLDEATFEAARQFARAHLIMNDSLGMDTLMHELSMGRRAAERVFRLLATSDDFCVVELDDACKVLAKRG